MDNRWPRASPEQGSSWPLPMAVCGAWVMAGIGGVVARCGTHGPAHWKGGQEDLAAPALTVWGYRWQTRERWFPVGREASEAKRPSTCPGPLMSVLKGRKLPEALPSLLRTFCRVWASWPPPSLGICKNQAPQTQSTFPASVQRCFLSGPSTSIQTFYLRGLGAPHQHLPGSPTPSHLLFLAFCCLAHQSAPVTRRGNQKPSSVGPLAPHFLLEQEWRLGFSIRYSLGSHDSLECAV